jgi:hypothetical protein
MRYKFKFDYKTLIIVILFILLFAVNFYYAYYISTFKIRINKISKNVDELVNQLEERKDD